MISIDVTKKLNFANSSELQVTHAFESNKISAIYGPSGAGKTSLLKIIAGLIIPESGKIEVEGKVWLDTNKKINFPPQKRDIGFVFQDYVLFPNMTVLQNMVYAAGKDVDTVYINHLLDITGLSGFSEVKPANLSGGQQQRLALARALARKPRLLLLDEPLSATDDNTRRDLQQQLLALQSEYQFSALVVSHNKREVLTLTENVLQLDNGKVVNSGTSRDLFGKADTAIVINATVSDITNGQMTIIYGDQTIRLKHQLGLSIGDTITLTLNADDGTISKA